MLMDSQPYVHVLEDNQHDLKASLQSVGSKNVYLVWLIGIYIH